MFGNTERTKVVSRTHNGTKIVGFISKWHHESEIPCVDGKLKKTVWAWHVVVTNKEGDTIYDDHGRSFYGLKANVVKILKDRVKNCSLNGRIVRFFADECLTI